MTPPLVLSAAPGNYAPAFPDPALPVLAESAVSAASSVAPPPPAPGCVLSDLLSGERGEIVRIGGHSSNGIRQRLLDMGVVRGVRVLVERHAPLGDPVEILVMGYHLALRMDEARHIQIRRLPA